jgi:IS30 family transposase
LSVHTQADLDAVADHLYTRPRKTLGWKTPSEMDAQEVAVALTT